MTLEELRVKCRKYANFNNCSKCGCYDDANECLNYLRLASDNHECSFCESNNYDIYDENKEYVEPNYCPVCGKPLNY